MVDELLHTQGWHTMLYSAGSWRTALKTVGTKSSTSMRCSSRRFKHKSRGSKIPCTSKGGFTCKRKKLNASCVYWWAKGARFRVVILQSLKSHNRFFCAAKTLCLRWFPWGSPTTACSTEQAHLIPNSHSVANRSVQRTYFGTGAPEDGYALPFWWQHRGRRHCHVHSSSVHAVMHARSKFAKLGSAFHAAYR